MKQFTYPNSQFISTLGVPSAGWTLNVYQTGTAILASIFQDAAQTVPADNPVVADASGYLASFYWTGTVDVVLVDASGNIQDSALEITDDITIINQVIMALNSNVLSGEATGSGDNILLSLPTLVADFTDIGFFIMRANAANTITQPVLTVNSLAGRIIQRYGGDDLVAGDIQAGMNCLMVFNSSTENYYLCNPVGADLLKIDGSRKMTGALDMDGHKVINLTAGSAAGDAVRFDQVQDHYGSATGTCDAMIAAIPSVLSYTNGMRVTVLAPTGSWSTIAPTININSMGAKNIVSTTGKALGYGDIQGLVQLVYVASGPGFFLLTNPVFGADYLGKVSAGYVESITYGNLAVKGDMQLRADYPVLWAWVNSHPDMLVAEASWAANKTKFSSGDGTTTFRLPDLRALTVRHWDDGAGVDTGRAIFSYQADDLLAHTHTYPSFNAAIDSGGGQYGTHTAGTSATGSTGGTENLVKNVALYALIRAY